MNWAQCSLSNLLVYKPLYNSVIMSHCNPGNDTTKKPSTIKNMNKTTSPQFDAFVTSLLALEMYLTLVFNQEPPRKNAKWNDHLSKRRTFIKRNRSPLLVSPLVLLTVQLVHSIIKLMYWLSFLILRVSFVVVTVPVSMFVCFYTCPLSR